jgi:hypothetical protein
MRRRAAANWMAVSFAMALAIVIAFRPSSPLTMKRINIVRQETCGFAAI